MDTLALYDSLDADERAALDAAVAEDPRLAAALHEWRRLRSAVRADLARSLPDRALLTLYALSDQDDVLTDPEREALEAGRPALEAALERHPGLGAAVGRVRADRDAFEDAWDAAASGLEAEPAPVFEPAPMSEAAPRRIRTVSADRAARGAARPAPAADRPAAPRAASPRPARWAFRVAALVAVVAFGSLVAWLGVRDAGLETFAGAQIVPFPDGTTAVLDDRAVLEVREGRGREARLVAGRALFRVATDPDDPFRVTTPNAEIAVLGTTFSVDATDIETEVVLVEGAVTLAPRAKPGAAVTLAPGQRSAVLALDAPSAPERADLGTLGWAGAVFVNEPVAGEIARRLSEHFGTPVSIDPSLAGERLSAADWGEHGLDHALRLLAYALEADLEDDGDGFRIVPRAPAPVAAP